MSVAVNPDDLLSHPPFGKLTAIQCVGKRYVGQTQKWHYLCQCACGLKCIRSRDKLLTGVSTHCGCETAARRKAHKHHEFNTFTPTPMTRAHFEP